MTKAIHVMLAAALAAAALAAAVALARTGEDGGASLKRLCAERFCGVVFL